MKFLTPLLLWATVLLLSCLAAVQGRAIPDGLSHSLVQRAKSDGLADIHPETVWRGEHDRIPGDVIKAGGFFSRGFEREMQGEAALLALEKDSADPAKALTEKRQRATSLFDYAKGMTRGITNYVSTSSEPSQAVLFSVDVKDVNKPGYLYKIHADEKMVDLDSSLGKFSPFKVQKEHSALGFIGLDQIEGWYEVKGKDVDNVLDKNNQVRPDAKFIPNPHYNAAACKGKRSSGPQPQLAGFPPGHKAWKEKPWKQYAGESTVENFSNLYWKTACTRNSQSTCSKSFRSLTSQESLQPGKKPVTQPETQPETRPEKKPDSQRETKPDTQSEKKPDTQSEKKPDSQPKKMPAPQPERKPSPKSGKSGFRLGFKSAKGRKSKLRGR